jgi:hypothetical protein
MFLVRGLAFSLHSLLHNVHQKTITNVREDDTSPFHPSFLTQIFIYKGKDMKSNEVY